MLCYVLLHPTALPECAPAIAISRPTAIPSPASRRVFAAQLRRDRRQLLAVTLQSRLACPGPLEIVADGYLEPPQAFDFQLHHIAVHERIEPAVVGAGRDDVAGIEMVDRGHPLDA